MRLAALSALTFLGCSYGYMDPMAHQEKAQAYRPSGLFADGRAMQAPPRNTVSREAARGSAAFLTGAVDGGDVAAIPMQLTAELLALGRHDFDVYCAACHGRLGDGNSPVARAMSLRLPPSLVTGIYGPGKMFRAITEGYGLMPSYAADLPVEERWAVIGYIDALRRSQGAPAEAAPPEVLLQLEREASP